MTTPTGPIVTDHPATFSTPILQAISDLLEELLPADADPVPCLDPFAGVGTLADTFHQGALDVTGVELQPAWANAHPTTIAGDATDLPFAADSFDMVITSPCYGNRMADSHDAKEVCSKCGGLGCPVCDGKGTREYTRNTYTHRLRVAGQEPVGGLTDSTVMQWGRPYREMHLICWEEVRRVLKPGGVFILNISNHVRGGVEKNVAEWHLHTLLGLGFMLWEAKRIRTRRQRFGANAHPDPETGADPRVDGELLLVLHNGTPRLWTGRQ